MNTEVYRYLSHTYGKRGGYWVGIASETVRSLMTRVWVVILMARITSNLAEHHIAAAKTDTIYFLMVQVSGSIIGVAGDLTAGNSENNQYSVLMIRYASKLTGKDMSFYRDNQSGYLVSLFRQYLDSAMELVRFFRTQVIRAVISLVIPTIILAVLNWKVGATAATVVVVQAVYIIWSSAKSHKWRHLSHEAYRKVTAEVSDAMTNITAYKSSGNDEQAHRRIAALAREEIATFWQRRKISGTLDLPRDIVTALGIAGAIYVILGSAAHNAASVGLIVLTLTYMFQIVRTVSDLPSLVTQHDDLVTKLQPTLRYLGTDFETIADPVRPKKLQVTQGTIDITAVDFSYTAHGKSGSSVPVFNNLTVHITGGQQVGIVGLSGAGKSTLASLLMRFDEITGGSIKIDGTDIRDIRQKDLHRQIAYVPQEPLLFHRTVRENIAYFNDGASEKEIVRAAKAAHAHDFIMALPEGYDSMVGERGVKLSGGQKQRVVIARAVLKAAPIILFDEATSALDSESEKIIQQALPRILGKRTALVIAHRLSTIANLDRILVIDHGHIIEDGTHSELLELNGRYAALWQKQSLSGKTS